MHAPDNSFALLGRLWRSYARPHWKSFSLAIVCMALVAGATGANAWMMKPVLNEVFFGKNATLLLLVTLAVISIAIINQLADYGQTVIMRSLGLKIIARMQGDLFAHLMRADITLFTDEGGRLISRFTNDITLLRLTMTTAITTMVRDFLSMVVLIVVMFSQSWQLALIAFAVFPTAVYPVLRIGKRMRKLSGNTQAQVGNLTARLLESFAAIRMVKAYGREDFEIERAHGVINDLRRLYAKSARVQAAVAPLMTILAGCAIGAVIWYGGSKVISGHTTPGAFFSFIAAALMSYKPTRTLSNLDTQLQESFAAATRFFALLDMPPRIADRPDAQPLSVSRGELVFGDVSFHYGPGGGGIDHVSFQVPPGKTAALVGLSGSGKSTIINLILRFYDIDAGGIRIDGQDIGHVTQASLRAATALVSQDIVLFDDTVRANIAYGRLNASEEEIVTAARMAAADDFIRSMPNGYDTVIGQNGVRLSGGQRQRTIARAMLKDAPILLLDEATSSLDAQSERSVQKALDTLSKGRTTLVVAHRLSTIVNADIIHVLEQGRIVESGTHAELLARRGRYSQLYAHQDHEPTS